MFKLNLITVTQWCSWDFFDGRDMTKIVGTKCLRVLLPADKVINNNNK